MLNGWLTRRVATFRAGLRKELRQVKQARMLHNR